MNRTISLLLRLFRKRKETVPADLRSGLNEAKRVQALPNEDLVKEYLKLRDQNIDEEIHIIEMMTRLWPDWAKRGH